jgi:hypothetical protein
MPTFDPKTAGAIRPLKSARGHRPVLVDDLGDLGVEVGDGVGVGGEDDGLATVSAGDPVGTRVSGAGGDLPQLFNEAFRFRVECRVGEIGLGLEPVEQVEVG